MRRLRHVATATTLLCLAATVSEGRPPRSGKPPKATPADITRLQASQFTLPGDADLTMVKIPAGKFVMGSPAGELGRQPDENQRAVTIAKPFYMCRTEVSQSQYLKTMRPGYDPVFARIGPWGHSLPEVHQGGPWKAEGKYHKNTGVMPMENVPWVQAVEFCKRLTQEETAAGRVPTGYEYRLPTEAEWEYACRAGATGPFNDQSIERLVQQRRGLPASVRDVRGANRFGLVRMHMGVAEWCLDDYGPYPSDTSDPVALGSGKSKVARGGDDGYAEHPSSRKVPQEDPAELRRYTRCASRAHFHPGIPYPTVGFRPVLAPTIETPAPKIEPDMLVEPMSTSELSVSR